MTFKKVEDKYFLRLFKDEEVLETLIKFCSEQSIFFGNITAIGGTHQATIGWYELSTKQYHWQEFSGNLEVVSLTGNISKLNGAPFIHIHTVLSNEKFECVGGHLKQALVGPTLEVVIEKIEAEVDRKLDDEIGLNLLNFENS